MAFPEGVHQVEVIRFGNSRLITPVGRRWGEFFVNGPRVFKGLCISTITLGELLYGVEKSARRSQNLQAVQQFTARLEVLPFSAKAAAHFGLVRGELAWVGHAVRRVRHADRGPCPQRRLDARHQQCSRVQTDAGTSGRQLGLAADEHGG